MLKFHAMKPGASIASPLWVGFDGKTLPAALSRWLKAGEVGGVVLFSRNLEGPRQVKGAVPGDPLAAAGKGRPAPLIAIDQEGGRVTVDGSRSPGSRRPGAIPFSVPSDRAAEAVGAASAAEFRAVGIDMNFAPVLDVDSNARNPVIGDRAL